MTWLRLRCPAREGCRPCWPPCSMAAPPASWWSSTRRSSPPTTSPHFKPWLSVRLTKTDENLEFLKNIKYFYPAGQMITTIVLLYSCKVSHLLNFPDLSIETFNKLWPLPLFHLGNLLCGLGGTQALSLPMMIVLRSFTILMTMIGG